jgi:hypothetical protein
VLHYDAHPRPNLTEPDPQDPPPKPPKQIHASSRSTDLPISISGTARTLRCALIIHRRISLRHHVDPLNACSKPQFCLLYCPKKNMSKSRLVWSICIPTPKEKEKKGSLYVTKNKEK